jgi:hypothetical protein
MQGSQAGAPAVIRGPGKWPKTSRHSPQPPCVLFMEYCNQEPVFGKLGELEKSKLVYSEPKKENKNRVILKTKGYPILVKEEKHDPDPIWINNSE